jgi:hypothetical protein
MGRPSKKKLIAKEITEICRERNISAKDLAIKSHLETAIVRQILSGGVEDIEMAVLQSTLKKVIEIQRE